MPYVLACLLVIIAIVIGWLSWKLGWVPVYTKRLPEAAGMRARTWLVNQNLREGFDYKMHISKSGIYTFQFRYEADAIPFKMAVDKIVDRSSENQAG